MRFWKRRREEKLYKQWSVHNGLPTEAIPRREVVGGDVRWQQKDRLRPYKERLLAIIKKLLRM